MLRIAKLTDYALLIMSQMARKPGAILSATALAEGLHLTVPTASKVLKMLAEGGLVTSLRGSEGGYRLSHPAEKIALTDILIAMEGQVAMTECCENANLCALNLRCTMQDNWQKINQLVQHVLGQFSLADMLRPLSPTKGGLGHDK